MILLYIGYRKSCPPQMHKDFIYNNLVKNLLAELQLHETSILLHTGAYKGPGGSYFKILSGWKSLAKLEIEGDFSSPHLNSFLEDHQGLWVFSQLSYDSKNLIEKRLSSNHPELIKFPLLHFFVPEYVLILKEDVLRFYRQDPKQKTCTQLPVPEAFLQENPASESSGNEINFLNDIQFEDQHREALSAIQDHLKRGDIYEINYCLPFEARGEIKNPGAVWWSMQLENQAPFAAFYRHKNSWLMCCSPERFISKNGQEILSQPIKGTSKRSLEEEKDFNLKEQLKNSKKEQSENVMIVDLVRNDLGKIAAFGSVDVKELFGIYSFKTVHQMISTIRATLKDKVGFSEIIQACFPMGSMTGAPKMKAMEIIEELEIFKRGLYSGSVGYISPEGNFDFNVVIRSILYNSETRTILYPAGGAITVNSQPDKEFEECLLKAKSMRDALTK